MRELLLHPGRAQNPWPVALVFAGIAAVILVIEAPSSWTALTVDPGHYKTIDYNLYMDATRSWLAGHGFYHLYQLAGPYEITPGDILYPPVALWLFAPFTVLPSALWWAIPLGVGAAATVVHRPSVITWPLLAIALAWQPTEIKILSGNPVIWAFAALAVGTHAGGWAVFVLLKPALAPFAFWGVNRRAWWGFLGAFALACLAVAPMWADWITVMVNSRNPSGLFYSWQEAPLLLIPIIAWWGGSGRRPAHPAAVETSRGLTARAPSS